MSEGPIKQWRDAHLPPRSVPQSQAMHLFEVRSARAVCGRNVPMSKIALPPKGIATCADCLAAATADSTNRENQNGSAS